MSNELDQELSLVSIMKSDPTFSERIQKVSKKIQKDRSSVMNMATKYSEKYKDEIAQGTEQEKLLLTEGASQGLTPEQTMSKYGKFLPTIRTPILNWLYYFMEEEKGIMNETFISTQAKDSRMTTINLMKAELGEAQVLWEDFENVTSSEIDLLTEQVKARHDKRFSHVDHTGLDSSGELKSDIDDSPEMMTYLYGNLTLDMFNKLKKLKNLTKSPNEHEAFRAFQACRKLCDKFNLEFDKIPT